MNLQDIQIELVKKNASGILFFDNECGLCQYSIQVLLTIDHKKKFLYAPLKGYIASSGFQNYDTTKLLNSLNKESIVYFNNKGFWYASDAVLWVLKDLSNLWSVLFVFKIIPKSLRDALYFLIAKYRKKFFKTKATCWVPQKKFEDLFLD